MEDIKKYDSAYLNKHDAILVRIGNRNVFLSDLVTMEEIVDYLNKRDNDET